MLNPNLRQNYCCFLILFRRAFVCGSVFFPSESEASNELSSDIFLHIFLEAMVSLARRSAVSFEVTYHLFPYTRWKELPKRNTFGAKMHNAFVFYLHLHFHSWIKKRTFAQKATTHHNMNT